MMIRTCNRERGKDELKKDYQEALIISGDDFAFDRSTVLQHPNIAPSSGHHHKSHHHNVAHLGSEHAFC